MLPDDHPDRIQIAFDDHRLVAGLILPTTLARHLGLPQLVDQHLTWATRRARQVASALAGGDCIDDADVLRTGGTARTLGGTVKAPSTLGTFLRSFRWGHVRQLDRVSRELLARAWAAGADQACPTIDLDSTICRDMGWGSHHGYTGQRGYHPLLAIAAGTGDVLMSRLREGRANTAAAPPTSCVRRWDGCATAGPGGNSRCVPTAASMPTPWSPSAAQWRSAAPSPSGSAKACTILSTRDGLDAHTLLDGRHATYTPFQSEPDAAPVRLISPVPNWPSSPPTAIGCITDYRHHAEI